MSACPSTADLSSSGAAPTASGTSLTAFAITGIASAPAPHLQVLQSSIGNVTAFTASRSHLIVQPRLRDQADHERAVERGRQGDRDDPAGRD
jgi:hypothetical protein